MNESANGCSSLCGPAATWRLIQGFFPSISVCKYLKKVLLLLFRLIVKHHFTAHVTWCIMSTLCVFVTVEWDSSVLIHEKNHLMWGLSRRSCSPHQALVTQWCLEQFQAPWKQFQSFWIYVDDSRISGILAKGSEIFILIRVSISDWSSLLLFWWVRWSNMHHQLLEVRSTFFLWGRKVLSELRDEEVPCDCRLMGADERSPGRKVWLVKISHTLKKKKKSWGFWKRKYKIVSFWNREPNMVIFH